MPPFQIFEGASAPWPTGSYSPMYGICINIVHMYICIVHMSHILDVRMSTLYRKSVHAHNVHTCSTHLTHVYTN